MASDHSLHSVSYHFDMLNVNGLKFVLETELITRTLTYSSTLILFARSASNLRRGRSFFANLEILVLNAKKSRP